MERMAAGLHRTSAQSPGNAAEKGKAGDF